MNTTPRRILASLALLACLGGCMSLDYDLASVSVPVSALPAGGPGKPFEVKDKDILWVHGLFGRSEPDVAAMLEGVAAGSAGVAGFRVTHGAGFHDWLITHLSLTLVRMKTVTVSGSLVGDG